jgi:hypothetical protein
MTREELIRLAARLVSGPVPTSHKKVYGYQGDLRLLLEVLPPALTLRTRVTEACSMHKLPAQIERIPGYLRESLVAHLQALQHGLFTSIIVLQEAVLLARYRVPLSFLYDLTGDAHAIILHVDEEFSPKEWTFPTYIHYNPETATSAIEQVVGAQFIRAGRGQETRP